MEDIFFFDNPPELIYCLQQSTSTFYHVKDGVRSKPVTTIGRNTYMYNGEAYDLILAFDENGHQSVWLGYWNNGYMKECDNESTITI